MSGNSVQGAYVAVIQCSVTVGHVLWSISYVLADIPFATWFIGWFAMALLTFVVWCLDGCHTPWGKLQFVREERRGAGNAEVVPYERD